MKECKELISVTSITDEAESRGVFFRWPVQKAEKEAYTGECYAWRSTAIFKIIPFILNIKLWFKCKKWFEEDNLAGIWVKELCSPIYFRRQERKAIHKVVNHPTIREIRSFGWEPYKNNCAGAAEKETTTIFFKDGTKHTILRRGNFHYCYQHTIEDMLKNGLSIIKNN